MEAKSVNLCLTNDPGYYSFDFRSGFALVFGIEVEGPNATRNA